MSVTTPFSDSSTASPPDRPVVTGSDYASPGLSVCWGAILAGVTAAMALQVLFMMLGAGLGFAIYNPLTNDSPIANLGAGAVVIQGISAVLSLWFGGWVAGRFTPMSTRVTGTLHGFCVWCAATVAGVLFVSVGAGWALGDVAKLVGGGLSLAGQPAAAIAGSATDMAGDALKQSGDALASFTDEAMSSRADNANATATVRGKRELGLALARFFNPAQEASAPANRTALVAVLVDQVGLSATDAERAVTDWTASYDRLKADLAAVKESAEATAREAADEAAKALSIFSLCAFLGFTLGAFAASHGARHGAECATRCEDRLAMDSI